MPSIVWTVRRKPLRLLAALAALMLAGILGAVVEAGQTAAATPPQPQRIDLAAGYPKFAKGYRLSLTEAIVPPGAGFPPHRHPGMQVAYIETGTLRYTVYKGSVKVFKGHPGSTQKLVRVIRAGHSGLIKTGEWIIETPGLHHKGANAGPKRVVILLATLLRSDEPPAIPVIPFAG
jgi:quercetin dioxygenase-like cupin family protein